MRNLLIFILFCASSCSIDNRQQNSPPSLVKIISVRVSKPGFLQYHLSPNFEPQRMEIQFFGIRGIHGLEKVSLPELQGELPIPTSAMENGLRWFNFLLIDENGEERWGNVSISSIRGSGLEVKTLDGGAAFYFSKNENKNTQNMKKPQEDGGMDSSPYELK